MKHTSEILRAARRGTDVLLLGTALSAWSCGGSVVAENTNAHAGDASPSAGGMDSGTSTGGTPFAGSSGASGSSAGTGGLADSGSTCGCTAIHSIDAGASIGCSANLLRCAGVCADPYNDPTNCGACSVKCSGASPICFEGACEPTAVCPSACGAGEECCGDRCCGPDEHCCASIMYTSNGFGPPLGGPTPEFYCMPKSAGSRCGFDSCEACWWSRMHVSSALVPCNDGSGRTDCCPADVTGPCTDEGLECWTPCSGGQRARHFCNGHYWVGGEAWAVFPCGGDAH